MVFLLVFLLFAYWHFTVGLSSLFYYGINFRKLHYRLSIRLLRVIPFLWLREVICWSAIYPQERSIFRFFCRFHVLSDSFPAFLPCDSDSGLVCLHCFLFGGLPYITVDIIGVNAFFCCFNVDFSINMHFRSFKEIVRCFQSVNILL